MAVGRIGASVLFGLPGNPVATMVTMLAFVRPALLRMSGANPEKYAGAPLLLRAACLDNLRKKPGRTEYQRGLVTRDAQGRLQVRTTTSNQGSGVLSSMVAANGLIVLHHNQGHVNAGDEVDVMMFEGVM
jgi:molybdopterin molybdotransferase